MNNETNFTQVTSDTLQQVIQVCLKINRPLFVWGNPGIGKSDNIRQVIQHYKDEGLRALLIDIRASQLDAVDTRGVPFTYEVHSTESDKVVKRTAWAIPDLFPTAEVAAAYDIIIIFLDELNNAPPSVQAALYQLVLDRKLGDYVLPDNVIVIAAGNLETDRGATHRMATPLADRFFHVELLVDNQAWEKWALGDADIHLAVVAYIRWRPEHLHVWDAKSPSKAQATPRGHEYVSDAIKECEKSGINGAVEAALISGKLGEAVGAELTGFLPIFRNLPDPVGVIMAPDAADIPNDPATMYALCGAIAQQTSKTNIDRVLRYATRVKECSHAGPEFAILLVRQAITKHPEVQQTKGFLKWATDNGEDMVK